MSMLHYSRHPFTLIEMLIVTAIVAMLFLAVLPRISSIPKRLIVEKACSDIQRAFDETALQARTSGKARTLTLQVGEEACFTAADHTENLGQEWMLPEQLPADPELEEGETVPQSKPFWNAKSKYTFSSEISWNTDDLQTEAEKGIQFTFFADGQAAGPDLEFEIKDRTFLLKLNPVTAQLTLEEITD